MATIIVKDRLQLAAVFTDNMVLQQMAELPVWGTCGSGVLVTVSFGGGKKSTLADENGNWRVNLAPMAAASRPQEMKVDANDLLKSTIILRNILIGEVWLCSGQSNMEFSVSLAKDGDKECASAGFPGIRFFTVPQRIAETPQECMAADPWKVCTPESVSGFSAAGYFFGRELHRKLGIPVGLIHASWGGTVAEAWTSRVALLKNAELADLVARYDHSEIWESIATYQEAIQRTRDQINVGYPCGWADLPNPLGEWNDIELPALWQARGLDFSGIFWFRKAVELPAGWHGKELRLSIGAADKSDITYFNNVKVGGISIADRPDSWSLPRDYAVPAHLTKPGGNVIAIRVHSDKFGGGMTGPAAAMQLSCPALLESAPVPLDGVWRYAVETNYGKIEIPADPPVGPDSPNFPCVLFNGMLFPVIPFAIRGAVWYQGESNVGRAIQYRTLFPAMIQDWRTHWNQGEFPFLFVQIANFNPELARPGESEWAELREAQTMALRLPHTGMAVAIDIGDAGDIHPVNKQDVGQRLAVNALAQVYGKQVPYSGPVFKSLSIEGNAMRIDFDHVNGKLECRGEKLIGFAIAGADRQFLWANAEIAGDQVIVSSPAIPEPEFVRYAWADNPACNLYNGAGLPAVPFRSDMPKNSLPVPLTHSTIP